MAETGPLPIVACLLRLAAAILDWVAAHPDAPLREREEALLGLVRAALPELMRAVMYSCTSALREPAAGSRQACPGCGKGYRPRERRGRAVLTAGGPVSFERPYHYCRACKA